MYVRVYICVCTYVHMHMYVCVYVCIYACMQACVITIMYIRSYIYYVHIHIQFTYVGLHCMILHKC